MRTAELIKKLKQLPEDTQVQTFDSQELHVYFVQPKIGLDHVILTSCSIHELFTQNEYKTGIAKEIK